MAPDNCDKGNTGCESEVNTVAQMTDSWITKTQSPVREFMLAV